MNDLVESDKNKILSRARSSIQNYALFFCIAITVLVAISYAWNIGNLDQQAIYMATNEARSNWEKDQAFRHWATLHGGVYVNPNARTLPNPYLKHLTNRDVETTDGVKLTLMNPAYMMRQMTSEFESTYGVKGRLTGQKLLNPANKADPWELNALVQFDQGVKEVIEQVNIEEKPHIRLMRPMIMLEGCLKCHGHLGYKVGDVRGGVSISIPLDPYFKATSKSKNSLLFVHSIFWLVGMLTIIFFTWRFNIREKQKHQAEKALFESEQQTRRVLDAAGEGIYGLDIEGKTTFSNISSTNMTGWSPEDLIGKSLHDILHYNRADGSSYPQEDCLICASIKDGKAHADTDEIFWHKDGSSFPVEYNSTPVMEGENLIGAVVVFHDITNRKLIEDELLKARKIESVGLLAGGIAHDFNNILTGLFGNIELAKQKLPPAHAAYSNIQNAVQALDRATNLTKQLLTFAKGGDPLLETINIKQIIQDSIKFILSGSNVKTTLLLPDGLWQVKADKGQLSQVITNLTINADQAMFAGGTLTIEAENINSFDSIFAPHLTGEVVKLSIADDGTGISEEHLKHIFDPYYTTKQSGSGLGLATSHSIISKHNGHITVDSKLDVGTRFTIYLPADSSIPQSIDATTTNPLEKSRTTSAHILIMDDDQMILDLSTEIIQGFGYTVDTAVDGKEAVEKYISAEKCGEAFDLVIMDLTIPGGLGGEEAVKELLAFDPEAKVIVSSGYSTDSIMANYLDYGFKGRLSKPFQLDEIQKELTRII